MKVITTLPPDKRAQVKEMLEAHLLTKHSALERHKAALAREADLRRKGTKAIHGHIRHGYQTGWVGQLVRIVTHRPPDSLATPDGAPRHMPSWKATRDHTIVRPESPTKPIAVTKGTELTMDPKGRVQIKLPGAKVKFVKAEKAGGKSAGTFYGPEAQQAGIDACMAIAQAAKRFDQCEVTRKDGSRSWVEFTFIYVECKRLQGGYGVAYERKNDFTPHSVDEVLEAVDDFLRWITVEEYAQRAVKPKPEPKPGREDPDLPIATSAKPGKLRFARWEDLLNFLTVDQILRNGVHAEIMLEGSNRSCTMMTVFPVTLMGDEGWAPGGFDAENCSWTGNVRSGTGPVTTLAVPTWL